MAARLLGCGRGVPAVMLAGVASAVSEGTNYGGSFKDMVSCALGSPCEATRSMLELHPMEWVPDDFLSAWKHEQDTQCSRQQMAAFRSKFTSALFSAKPCNRKRHMIISDTGPVGETVLEFSTRLYEQFHCNGCRVNIIDSPTWQFVASNDSSICRGRGWYCLFSTLISDEQDLAVIRNRHNQLHSAGEQKTQPPLDESCSLETPWPLGDPSRGMGPEMMVGFGAAYAVASRPTLDWPPGSTGPRSSGTCT